MNKAIAAIVLLILVACTAPAKSPSSERAEYWGQRLSRELPAGTPQSAVLQWASTNHLSAIPGTEPRHLLVGLEYVKEPTSGLSASPAVCAAGWTKVQTLGNCL
jgi:hypothetical protein